MLNNFNYLKKLKIKAVKNICPLKQETFKKGFFFIFINLELIFRYIQYFLKHDANNMEWTQELVNLPNLDKCGFETNMLLPQSQ